MECVDSLESECQPLLSYPGLFLVSLSVCIYKYLEQCVCHVFARETKHSSILGSRLRSCDVGCVGCVGGDVLRLDIEKQVY